jgi:hypothetical protein
LPFSTPRRPMPAWSRVPRSRLLDLDQGTLSGRGWTQIMCGASSGIQFSLLSNVGMTAGPLPIAARASNECDGESFNRSVPD